MDELTRIANECRTDKGTVEGECHNYTSYYNRIFQEYKELDRKLNILEIGVYKGASIKMLNDYFGRDKCDIYGIDIDFSLNTYNADNVHYYKVNQNSHEEIEKFINDIGNIKFDIIIDDGSHQPEHQFHSLLYLYKHVNEYGIYILEDLHTWVWESQTFNSPLYFLNFYNFPSHLLAHERNELTEAIKNVNINIRQNKKSPYCKHSITSIIEFK
jgi:hypothetical protein